MTTVRKVIGRLPVLIGEWQSNYREGQGYMKNNRVLIFNSELQSKIDNNTYAPATQNTTTGVITFDTEHWTVIHDGTQSEGRIKALEDDVDTIETAVGSGGSVDTRIANAKSEIIGDAASDYNTLGKLEDKIQAEALRATTAEGALDTAKADKATTLAGYGIQDAYTKSETYTKTEVNGLVDTPHQNYVTVQATSQTTAATDVLPASGQAADTIYRVSNWDGSSNNGAGSFDVTKYSEYAWDDASNPNKYVFLCVKTAIGEVFDISVYNNNAKYADLKAALGTNGANVPDEIRRGGMSVKFVQSSDNRYVQWRLVSKDWSIDTNNWVAENEDFRNEVMREVNEAIDSIQPIEITGDVTNAPDEEDLTSVNVGGTDVLKFKDKAYNPLTYSGMGRKILRKNIVDGVNTLTQSMMTDANTIYVIQYDYSLGEDITIPANCVLQFDGGSLSNGTIVGQNTLLQGDVKCYVTINGTFLNDKLDITWFGAKGDGEFDNAPIIQMLLDNVHKAWIYFPIGDFAIYSSLLLAQRNYLMGESRDYSIISAKAEMDWMFKAKNTSIDCEPSFMHLKIFGGPEQTMNPITYAMTSNAKGGIRIERDYYQSIFEDVRIEGIEGIAVYIKKAYHLTFRDIWILRCKCGFVCSGNGVSIKDSWFAIIERYGIFSGANFSVTVAFCTLENIGKAGIVLYNGGQGVVENCYFEKTSRNGIDVKGDTGDSVIAHVYSDVILTGRIQSIDNDFIRNSMGNIMNASVCNNDIQKNTDGDFIFASQVSGLAIINNIIRGGGTDTPSESAIFACIPRTGSLIEDVTIFNNVVAKYTSSGFYVYANKWTDINMYAPDPVYGKVNNVRTDQDTPFIKDGVSNNFYIRTNADYVETGTTRPTKAPEGLCLFDKNINRPIWRDSTNSKWLDAVGNQADNKLIVPISASNGWEDSRHTCVATIVSQNSNSYKIQLKSDSNNRFRYRFTSNNGETWTDWYLPLAMPFGTKRSGTFSEKPSSGLSVGVEYYCTDKQSPECTSDGVVIYYKGNSVWTDSLGRIVDTNYPQNYKGAFADKPTLGANDAGWQYYDATNNRIIIWNGTAWYDATGTPV